MQGRLTGQKQMQPHQRRQRQKVTPHNQLQGEQGSLFLASLQREMQIILAHVTGFTGRHCLAEQGVNKHTVVKASRAITESTCCPSIHAATAEEMSGRAKVFGKGRPA